MVAILKFFKRHLLPNRQSDWAETWWEASQWHRDSKLVLFGYPRWLPIWAASLKIFKRHLLLNPKSYWAETWWEASQWHGHSTLLKSFHSDSKMADMVTILKFIKPQVEPKLDGRQQGEMEIQNCWNIQFQYPRWRPWWQSWNSSNNIRFWIAKGNLIW